MWEIFTKSFGLETYINETTAKSRMSQLERNGTKFTVHYVNC